MVVLVGYGLVIVVWWQVEQFCVMQWLVRCSRLRWFQKLVWYFCLCSIRVCGVLVGLVLVWKLVMFGMCFFLFIIRFQVMLRFLVCVCRVRCVGVLWQWLLQFMWMCRLVLMKWLQVVGRVFGISVVVSCVVWLFDSFIVWCYGVQVKLCCIQIVVLLVGMFSVYGGVQWKQCVLLCCRVWLKLLLVEIQECGGVQVWLLLVMIVMCVGVCWLCLLMMLRVSFVGGDWQWCCVVIMFWLVLFSVLIMCSVVLLLWLLMMVMCELFGDQCVLWWLNVLKFSGSGVVLLVVVSYSCWC